MIKQFVPSEFCLNKCRICCRFSQQNSVWAPCVLDEEIEVFLQNNIPPSVIALNKKIRLEPHPKGDTSGLPEHIGPIFICPFLNLQDNQCKVYSIRPFECQLYPFLVNKRNNKVFLAVDLGCPFVKENLETREFKEFTQYLAGLFHQPEYKTMLRNNPQLIQAYEDAKDLSEIKL